MKKIVTIKPFKNQFVAHVYEHMVAFSVIHRFREQGLLPYIDYTLDAKTYYKGALLLEVFLYSDQAIAMADTVIDTNVIVSKKTIDTALLQISAEKSLEFIYIDYYLLKKDLRILHNTPWQNVQDSPLYLAQEDMPLEYLGVTYKKLKSRKKLTFEQSIILGRNTMGLEERGRFIQSVALVLALILQASLQEDVAEHFRCYSTDLFDYDSTNKVIFVNKFHTLKENRVDSEELQALSTAIMRSFETPDFIQKLATLNIEDEDAVPALKLMLEYLGMNPGARYWSDAVNSTVVHEAVQLLSVE